MGYDPTIGRVVQYMDLSAILIISGFIWAIVLWHISGQRWVPPMWSLTLRWVGTLGGLAMFITAIVLIYLRPGGHPN